MKKHLYDVFADKWLKDCDSIWLYSDPHFSDLESYKLRFPSYFDPDYFEDGYDVVTVLDEMQIKNINAKAGKNATIIILGDVGNVECIRKLKARYKVLIMGNHDKGASNYQHRIEAVVAATGQKRVALMNTWDATFLRTHQQDLSSYKELKLFDEVYEGPLFINDRLVLSHEPITGYGNIFYNIHGHVHNAEYKGDTTHMNVCAEAINYKPVNLLSLLKNGLLKNIDNIHRQTIDFATERKAKRK